MEEVRQEAIEKYKKYKIEDFGKFNELRAQLDDDMYREVKRYY